jgi:transcriptional regulator with XRE-family HTH domain
VSPERIAQMLKKLRKEHGLSQRALAKRARTTAGYIGILETGKKAERVAGCP